jgi:predicted enzyme related to lactoylglutathione lyase
MSDATGSFIWYELMTTDSDAAAKFYGNVIGWNIGGRPDAGPGGQDYRMIGRTDGGFAGGVLKLTSAMVDEGAHPTWLGYLHVNDVDASVRAIVADGGKLLMPRMDLPVGKIAMVTDPLGTPFYVMTPIPPPDKPDAKSDVFDPVAMQRVRWNELASPDLARAKAFYAKHFGFAFNETMSMGAMGDYCFIAHGGVPMIGAIMQKPAHGPSFGWLFYFGVSSVAAAKNAIEAGGGTILSGPQEVPGGQWIVVAGDPQGASFGVVGPKS